MNFRTTLSNIYPLLLDSNSYIYIFFIGSYPQRPDSNHELPIILNQLKTLGKPIKKIYIDPEYSKESLNTTLLRVGHGSIIHTDFISPIDYTMILEFCHIAGHLKNSLSIIFEFSGSQRKQPEKREHQTPYLYITPSNCLGNTNDTIYKPIIENDNGKLYFYNPENFFSAEIVKLFKGEINNQTLLKLKYMKRIIKNYIFLVKDIYRMLFNYIERPECFDVSHNVVFTKNEPFFHPSLELLKKRMIGYNYNKVKRILDDFEKSDFSSLDIFIKEKIQYYISLIILFINNGDYQKVNDNYELLIFNNSQDVLKIINKLNDIFVD